MEKIVIAGGTGFIGHYIAKRFKDAGCKVVLVSRQREHVQWAVASMTSAFEGASLVLNLAGSTINCKHTLRNRELILSSRLQTTKLVGEAISECQYPPKVWINASASAIYTSSEDVAMDDFATQYDTDFMADVVRKWEEQLFSFNLPHTQKAALRTSVVLGRGGGALSPLLFLTKFGLGGTQASGNQKFSWIHIEDYFRVLLFLLKNEYCEGVVNCTSPYPVSNKVLMTELRNAVSVPIGLPAPELAIKMGAWIIGTESVLLLKSTYMIPKRLNESGFQFLYPTIAGALSNLIDKAE